MKKEDIENLKEMLVDFEEYSTDYTKTRCEELEETIENTLEYIHKLQQRIDKAIEYLKTHSEMTDLQICGIENVLAFRGSATKLLEILGDKENE